MDNKVFGFALCTLLLALCFPAEAQQPAGKVSRIGLVTQGSGTGASSVRADALRQGLRELGWIEGKNITIEHRQSGGKADRSPALAGEMVRLKVDVMVWSGGVQGAKQIKTIPVVYVATTDLVSTGLVESLARPGGNITGLSSLARELSGKRLELLKETFPKVSRVAFLFNPGDPPNTIELEQLRGPAAALGLTLRAVEARGPDQIEPAFSMMIRERAEGLFTASGLGYQHQFTPHRRASCTEPASSSLPYKSICRSGWTYVLRTKFSRHVSPRGCLCGQNPQGRQARGASRRATDEVRVRHKS
jgi:ABC-type uncharacterized transport system substrate-binding protein